MRTWSTKELPPTEQFGYWREVVCEAFTSLDPAAAGDEGFESSVTQQSFGDVLISSASSRAQTIRRGSREIARDGTSGFFVNFQLGGTCRMQQDAHEALVQPGQFYLVDTTRPYRQDYSDWDVLCLYLPRHLLESRLFDPRHATARPLSCTDQGLGTIAGTFIRSLRDCDEHTDPAAKALLVSSLAEVLGIALGNRREKRDQARQAVQDGLRASIERYIQANATHAGLSIASVAGAFRISPRYLCKLLEGGGGTLGKILLEERLRRAAALLAADHPRLPISEVAYASGFADLSNFCRAFKQRFGVSARHYRTAS